MTTSPLMVRDIHKSYNGRKVLEISDQVLALAHQGTQMLEKQSTTSAGRLVNISGRQRMLSQRMAKFYQAQAWGAPAGPRDLDHIAGLHLIARDVHAAAVHLQRGVGRRHLLDLTDKGRQGRADGFRRRRVMLTDKRDGFVAVAPRELSPFGQSA